MNIKLTKVKLHFEAVHTLTLFHWIARGFHHVSLKLYELQLIFLKRKKRLSSLSGFSTNNNSMRICINDFGVKLCDFPPSTDFNCTSLADMCIFGKRNRQSVRDSSMM